MADTLRTAAKKKGKGPRGRPFPKGVSGNPGGRPKGLSEFRLAAREYSDEALRKLVTLMRARKRNPAASASVRAVRELLDRAWGKPVQELAVQGSMAVEVTRDLSDEDMRAIARRLAFTLKREAVTAAKDGKAPPPKTKKKLAIPA